MLTLRHAHPAGFGDFYNVTTSALAAASACINLVTLAEDAARNGDVTSATVAIYVAQETTAAAAAALQKDYSSAVNHTNTVRTVHNACCSGSDTSK